MSASKKVVVAKSNSGKNDKAPKAPAAPTTQKSAPVEVALKPVMGTGSSKLPDAMAGVLKIQAAFGVKYSEKDKVLIIAAPACDSFHQAVFISAEVRKAVKKASYKDHTINWNRKDGLACVFVPKSSLPQSEKKAKAAPGAKKAKASVKRVEV